MASVFKATYGHNNDIIDVTEMVLQKFVKDGKLTIPVCSTFNTFFGDPIKNKMKTLTICYKGNTYLFNEENKVETSISFDIQPLIIHEGNVKLFKLLTTGGLVNQLMGLMYLLYFAHYAGRDVAEPMFTLDSTRAKSVPLAEIVDIPHLNSLIKKYGFKSKIVPVPNLISHPSPLSNKPRMSTVEYVNLLKAEPHPYISLDAFNWNLTDKSFIESICYPLIGQIKFDQYYHDIAAKFTPPGPYVSVHLRLENDILNTFPLVAFPNEDRLNVYREIFAKYSPDQMIFIATALKKTPNLNNPFMDELDEKYKIFLSAPDSIERYGNVPKRELYAIVDMIICRGGTEFSGLIFSSFTRALMDGADSNVVHFNNKKLIVKRLAPFILQKIPEYLF